MAFKPTTQWPIGRAQGASAGIVSPCKLARALQFNPNGAWLFAYMFRRFGPPNCPSDAHKNLASWCLTTPKRGCYLTVTPYLGDDGVREKTLSFGYFLANDLYTKAQTAPPATRRQWREWDMKVFKWALKRGISIIGDRYLDKRKPINQYPYGNETSNKRWLVWTNAADQGRPVKLNLALLRKAPMRIKSDISTAYQKAHPKAKRPAHPYENPRVIHQIEIALLHTLHELERPIYVRDLAFDTSGQIEDSVTKSAEPYEFAGYACKPNLPRLQTKPPGSNSQQQSGIPSPRAQTPEHRRHHFHPAGD